MTAQIETAGPTVQDASVCPGTGGVQSGGGKVKTGADLVENGADDGKADDQAVLRGLDVPTPRGAAWPSNNERRLEPLKTPLRRFGLDTVRYFPAKLVPALMSLASAYVFTRVFTAQEYGAYSVALAVASPLIVVLTEWAAQPVGRFYSEYVSLGRSSQYGAVLRFFARVVSVGGVLAGVALFWSLRRAWGDAMAAGVAVYVLFGSVSSLLYPLFPASLDAGFYTVVHVGGTAIQFGLAVTLVFILGRQPSFLIWAAALSSGLLLPLLIRRASRHVRLSATKLEKADIRRFASYGIPMLIWFFAAQLLSIGDRYFIEFYRGSAEVGIYSANYGIASAVGGLLGAPITLAAFPVIMRMWAEGQKSEIRRVIREMTGWYLILATGLLGGLVIMGQALASLLLGSEFQVGYTVWLPVYAGAALWQVSMLGHKGLELCEKTPLMLAWALVAAGTNVLLNWWAVPRYGYIAAAYTTLASYLLYTTLIWASTKRFIPWDIPWLDVSAAGASCIAGVWVARAMVAGAGLWPSALRSVIYVGVFALGTVLLKHAELSRVFRNVRTGDQA